MSASTSASSPPNLVSTFANTDLLGNDTGIIGSLDNYLGQLQSLLNGQLFGLDIPVVGKALASAGSFVMQLKSDIDAIGSASGFQQIYDALTNALSAFDPATPVVQIQYLTTGSSTWANFTSGESVSSLPIPAGYRGRPDHLHARRHLDAGDLADVRSWPARPGSDGQQRRGDGQRRLEPDVHPGHRSRCRALYRYRLVEHRQHPDGRHRNGRRQRQPGSRRRDHRTAWLPGPDRETAYPGSVGPGQHQRYGASDQGRVEFLGRIHRRLQLDRRRVRRSDQFVRCQ